jgi:hypothetical protein
MPAVCEEHGRETQLRCATCDKPICNRCLVETRVGFKCQEHGRPAAARPQPDAKNPARPRRVGSGMGLFPILLVSFVVFPLTIGFGALFAVTPTRLAS